MTNFRLSILIIHYNNPDALSKTIKQMIAMGLKPDCISVFDNRSEEKNVYAVKSICSTLGVNFMPSDINRGWGAAINYFLDYRSWEEYELLMISAHDAWIEKFDMPDVLEKFNDPKIAFVCPQYPEPIVCDFSLSRSFKCRSSKKTEFNITNVIVGHGTLCVVKPQVIKTLRFDEEYFIYGCESEIFLRAYDNGYKTIVLDDFVVSNPQTDSDSDFVTRAFAVNSIYTAKKRGGVLGFTLRTCVVLGSSIRLILAGNFSHGFLKASSALWSVKTYGKGFFTYIDRR